MIKNKFSGYSRDGIRRLFDPATIAAFTAGMSSAGTAAAVGTAAAGTGAAIGTGAALGAGAGALGTMGATGALGAAAPAALSTVAPQIAASGAAGATGLGAAAPEIAANLAAAGQAGAPMAQGIMQGGAQAAAASGAPGAVPGAVGAAPAAPAGGDTAAMMTDQVGPMVNMPPPTQPGLTSATTPSPIDPAYEAATNAARDRVTASKVAEKYAAEGGGGIMDGLAKGFNTAMKFASDHPFYTTAGLYGAQKLGLFGGGMEQEEDKYKSSVDMSGFRGWEPNPTFRGFADGGPVNMGLTQGMQLGPVEQMSEQNITGGNASYPMAYQAPTMYGSPARQNPISQNILSVDGSTAVDPYSGEQKFAKGGKTETFFEQVMREDEERRAQARRSMRDHTPDISGPGIIQRTLTQQQKRPDEAAKLQLASIAKQSGVKLSDMPKANVPEDFTYEAANGGIMRGDLGGYSDGGRLLRGPGDGVSDSIPAVIGKHQPARLADGEFVVPARIVSELGNGSTEAGARKLYAMMERVQKRRKKSIGKGKVAVDSKADKLLPT